jgi:hypothetical protein
MAAFNCREKDPQNPLASRPDGTNANPHGILKGKLSDPATNQTLVI